jgi:Ca2+/H+ antiporter
MLFRFISTVSLVIFLLLGISGTPLEDAIYRSLIVFTMLFAGAYVISFVFSVIRNQVEEQQQQPQTETVGGSKPSAVKAEQ